MCHVFSVRFVPRLLLSYPIKSDLPLFLFVKGDDISVPFEENAL